MTQWFGRLFGGLARGDKAAPPYAGRRWTSADGLSLYARDYSAAEGPVRLPVICLHGLTRNSADFEDVAPWIAARGRRVLAVDVRGRGLSDWDPQPMNYHPGTYAADVLALLEGLGIGKALFVGTSMGGLITMTLAALRPGVVAGTALNDVGPKLSPVGLGRIAGYAGQVKTCETWEQAASSMRTVNQSAFPDLNQTDWLAFAHRTFQPAPGGGLRPSCDPDISAPIKAMAAAPPSDLTPFFTGLTSGRPTLLVRGELSDLIDAPIAEEMRRLAPDMDYAEVPRVGHAPMLTEPRAQEALAAWLDKAP